MKSLTFSTFISGNLSLMHSPALLCLSSADSRSCSPGCLFQLTPASLLHCLTGTYFSRSFSNSFLFSESSLHQQYSTAIAVKTFLRLCFNKTDKVSKHRSWIQQPTFKNTQPWQSTMLLQWSLSLMPKTGLSTLPSMYLLYRHQVSHIYNFRCLSWWFNQHQGGTALFLRVSASVLQKTVQPKQKLKLY